MQWNVKEIERESEKLVRQFGADIAQECILQVLEGRLPAHRVYQRARMMLAREGLKNRRFIQASRSKIVQEKFYGGDV